MKTSLSRKAKKKLKAHEKCIFFQEFFLHSQEAFPKTEKSEFTLNCL
jgi:hypothetical protein